MYLERGYESIIRIEVRNNLEPTAQRDNLSFDMLLQDPARPLSIHKPTRQLKNAPNQAQPNLLIEHLQHLLASAPLEELAVGVQALDGLHTTLRRAQLERGIFRGIVFSRLRQCEDDMLDLVVEVIRKSEMQDGETHNNNLT